MLLIQNKNLSFEYMLIELSNYLEEKYKKGENQNEHNGYLINFCLGLGLIVIEKDNFSIELMISDIFNTAYMFENNYLIAHFTIFSDNVSKKIYHSHSFIESFINKLYYDIIESAK